MIIQSGSVLGALTNNDRRLRYNFFVSSGSENVTTAADYLILCLNQKETKVIGMFLESVRNPKKFVEGLQLAKEKKCDGGARSVVCAGPTREIGCS